MKTNSPLSAVWSGARFSTALRALFAAALALCAPALNAQVNTHGVAAWGGLGFGQSASSNATIIQIVSSGGTTAALRADGTVVVWGYDGGGECSVPAGLTGVIQIAMAADHTVALKSDGTVVCWGDNSKGESTVPAGLTDVVQVAAGDYHTVALKANGTVVCWGDNSLTQLQGAPTGDVVAIAAGSSHSLALKSNGTVYGWGNDWETGATTIPSGLTNVIQIAASSDISLALLANGTMVKWGNGDFPIYPNLTDIVQVAGTYALKSNGTVVNWQTGTAVPGMTGIVQIASSFEGVSNDVGEPGGPLIALKANGSLTCYGDDTWGESFVPNLLQGTTQVSIGYQSMAFLKNGLVSFVGANKYGESSVPAGLTDVLDVQTNGSFVVEPNNYAYDSAHSVALKSNGTVVCWGDNRFGQNEIPTGLANVVQISAGFAHTAARLKNGKVVCWGYNTVGECDPPSNLPAVQDIAAGGFHTVALTTAGEVVCWGSNYYGECSVPAGLKNVVHVSAGLYSSSALESDGTVVCWGGGGDTTVPSTLKGALEIASGNEEMIAMTDGGPVVGWGALGVSVPSFVNGAVGISGGYDQMAALGGLDMYFTTPTVEAGSSSDLDFFLPTPPGSAGAEITLTSSSSSVQVPASLHLGEGIQSTTLTAHTAAASAGGVFTVTAHYLGGSFTATLRVLPRTAPASSLSFMLPSVEGGATAIGYVKLGAPVGSAGEAFTVKSNSPIAASGLAAIEVPAGAGSFQFPVVTQPVASISEVRIYVYQGAALVASAPLEVYAPATLSLGASTVHGGLSTTVTVHFAFPIDISTGVDVDLLSSSPLVSVPATTIVFDATTLTVPVTTKGVNAATNVTISMVTPSGKNPGVTLTLTPAVVSSISVSPTVANGNGTVQLKVNLLGTAGPAGLPVAMSSNSALAEVPATVTVPSDKTTGTFSFLTGDVTKNTAVTLKATTGTVSEDASFTLEPAPNKLVSISLNFPEAPAGDHITLTATLSGPSGPSGLTIALKASPAGIAGLPATITAPAGTKSVATTFTGSGALNTRFTIEATEGTNTATTTYTIIAATLGGFILEDPANYFTSESFTVQGGQPVSAVLFSTGPSSTSIIVSFVSSDTTHIPTPPNQEIGSNGFDQFQIATKAVTKNENVVVTAKSGTVSYSVTITLNANPVSPATLIGMNVFSYDDNGVTEYYVQLYPYGASTKGFTVNLKSSNETLFPLPATALVGTSAEPTYVYVTLGKVTQATPITVTAAAGSVTLTQTVTVNPP